MNDLEDRLERIVRGFPRLMHVLEVASDLDLPDWLLFSGAVCQPVWNHLTGRPPDHGVRDFDLAYFDDDTLYEAEDRVIRRVAAAFDPATAKMVEVRNQARVHLWFESRFGEPYAPLRCTAEALSRFVSPAFAVGVRLESDDRLRIEAPFGLEDLFGLRITRNPLRPSTAYDRIASGLVARWPELQVDR